MHDEMERMPHKKPDDDMARIVKEFTPRTLGFIEKAHEFGGDVFISKQVKDEFFHYRQEYEEAMGLHFDHFIAPAELPPNATDKERGDKREFDVQNMIELNENEAIAQFATEHAAGPASQKALQQQLEIDFGTLRNQYLQAKNQAADVTDDWVGSLGDRSGRTKS